MVVVDTNQIVRKINTCKEVSIMSTRQCMVCRKNIPLEDFKLHFVQCRASYFGSKKKIGSGKTVSRKTKGCGCGKKKK